MSASTGTHSKASTRESMKKWTRTLLSERGRERRETKLAGRSRASFLNDNGCKVIKKKSYSKCVCLFCFPFRWFKPPLCVVRLVPIFKQWRAEPSRLSVTHRFCEERGAKRSAPINKACLIQPQRSSLPSCLCLRKDTTAVTQTGVYPRLRAAGRAIIHRLACQRRLGEGTSKVGTKVGKRERKRWK